MPGLRSGVDSLIDHRMPHPCARPPDQSLIRQLRKVLADTEVKASPQELVQWFRTHLSSPITRVGPSTVAGPLSTTATVVDLGDNVQGTNDGQLVRVHAGDQSLIEALQSKVTERFPDVSWRVLKYYVAAEVDKHTFMAVKKRNNSLIVGLTLPADMVDPAITDNTGEFNWRRITKITRIQSPDEITDTLLNLVDAARRHAGMEQTHQRYGVTLSDLIAAGVLTPGTTLVFTAGSRDLARATLGETGEILWEGRAYRFLSDKTFAQLLGPTRTSVNGWTSWVAELPSGRQSLDELRSNFMARAGQVNTG